MTARNKKLCVAAEKKLASPDNEAVSEQAGNNVNVTINLRKIPLLAQLTATEMTKVKKELQVRRYARREVIIKKRANGDNLLFLLSGRLQAIDMTDEGRVIGLQLLSAGEFFGETTLINQSLHTSSVIALSDVLVAFLSRTTALHLFSHSPPVASQIQKHLAQKVQLDYKFRAMLSINNTAKRISKFLVLMKQKTVGKQELVENLPTHQEIASMINTSRETVTRTLLTLTHQGIIRKDARRLIIVRPEALQKMTKSL
jgi:CRP/FNR family transcriptional regulator, cyclic AMP receptor protein